MPELMLVNPRKRRRTTRKRATPKRRVTRRRAVRRSPTRAAKRRMSGYRRNPSPRGMRGIVDKTVIPAATAAAGAIGLDVAWGFLPVPDTLKTGPMRHVAKAAGAVGLGMLANMVVSKKTADQFATGALTVVFHQAMAEVVQKAAPDLPMNAYPDQVGYWGTGYSAPALPADDGLNAYPSYDYNETGEFS